MKSIFDKSRMYEYETGFSLTADSERYGKMLTHYELYKKIIDLPGELIECGVYRGTSLLDSLCSEICLRQITLEKL